MTEFRHGKELKEHLSQVTDSLFFFLNTFIEIYFTYHTVYQCKVYSSVSFGILHY